MILIELIHVDVKPLVVFVYPRNDYPWMVPEPGLNPQALDSGASSFR